MNRPVVFVDTNCADNRGSATAFLGGRADLEKIAKRAKIILPKVVFDELCQHISTYLGAQLDGLKRNPHRHYLGISDAQIATLDISVRLTELIKKETIPYEILDLQKKRAAYEEIYEHSVKGTPPFNPGGDKGFKDSLIAKTIDEFIYANPKHRVFLLTKDELLKSYFQDSDVQIITSFQDFDREYSEDKIEDQALLDRIWDYFDEVGVELPERKPPNDQWLNYEGDIVAFFKDETYGDVYALIDSVAREPLSFIGESLPEVIRNLENVGSFQAAHSAIAEVDYIFAYCNLDYIKTIAQIMLSNDQIYGIGGDEDVSQFVAKLFNALDENSESALAEEVKTRYGLRLLTDEQLADLPLYPEKSA